jgi:hypothetical protein
MNHVYNRFGQVRPTHAGNGAAMARPSAGALSIPAKG